MSDYYLQHTDFEYTKIVNMGHSKHGDVKNNALK